MFHGKRVLVTGAASGIGRATTLMFAAQGADVTIGDINLAGLAETASLIEWPVQSVQYDAADYDSCRELVKAAAQGGLHVLCNIAGMHDWGPSANFGEDRFDRSLHINLSSLFALSRAAIPHLIQTQGNIVNVSSAAGLGRRLISAEPQAH